MSHAQSNELAERFVRFYRDYARQDIGDLAQKYPKERKSLYIDYNDLYRFDASLAEDYCTNPGDYQAYAEQALQLFDLPADVKLDGAHTRLVNLPETAGIRNLRVNDDQLGTLVQVTGIVRKATDVRPKIVEAAFECQRCGTPTYIPQDGNGFEEPHECKGCERQGPFEIDFDQSSFVDSQKIRVQESPEGLRGGETPQAIDVELEDDITGHVTAGDTVTVTGVLHIEQVTSGNAKTPVFEYYLEGRSVAVEDGSFEDFDITSEEVATIEELARKPDIYERMVDSVAPAIFGYDEPKLAMILQLFSGVTKHLPDGTRIRGDFHMLFIGDPGTAKSQLIRYVRNVAPRSVYTSGKGSSSAGLTAAAVRDDFGDGNQWTLEAGALVLADKGIAAIDELDKMDPNDRSAMHEALEQQEVSVAKAGMNATLKSRCSVLGAANPVHGRFDEYEPISEQIDLEPALISRFDLIFTFIDEPDPDEDAELADHILHTNREGQLHAQNDLPQQYQPTQSVANETGTADPEIEQDLLRKYIAHAVRSCKPVMTDGALDRIRDFYVSLRNEGDGEDSAVPVTARKLEALVRLSEASARVRLSDTVEREDADRVIAIVQSCLEDVGIDPETGNLDADMVEAGTSKSQRDRITNMLELTDDMADHYDNGLVPTDDLVDSAQEHLGIDEHKAEKTLDKLLTKGELMQPSRGEVRTT